MPFKKRKCHCLRQMICFLVCLLTVITLAAPAGVTEEAADHDKVVLAGWYDSAFNSIDDNERRSGYAYEYQMKIAAYTGWHYDYVSDSWPNLLTKLENGEIDLLSDVSKKPGREEMMLFSDLPMGSEDYYLFISQDNTEIRSSAPDSLKGKKIGVNAGSYQRDLFISWAESKNLRVVETADQAVPGEDVLLIDQECSEEKSMEMLRAGELDGYVTVDSFSASIASDPDRPVPVYPIGTSDFYFAVNKEREDLLDDLNEAMYRIQQENRYYNQELSEKHLVTAGANALLSDAEKAWLEQHGEIRVAYQDNYLAFCAADPETGELTGALKDYLDYAAEHIANAQITFRATAYPTAQDAIDALKRGEADCVFPANLSAGDGENMGLYMTSSLMRTDIFAVVRLRDRQVFNDREHVVVAVNEGNPNYISCLRDNFPTWRTVVYPTTSDCLEAVSHGIADCVLISSYRYNNIARQCEKLNLTTVATPAGLEYCFAVADGQPELYSIMSRIADIVPQSTVNASLSHYIAADAKSTLWDFVGEHRVAVIAIIGALLVLILVLMIRSLRAEKKASRLIAATETDQLTGLYNRDYFLQYAEQAGREHPGTPMDAIVLNIDRFHVLNALNGRDFGDQVLRTLGGEIREAVKDAGGIAGRFEADQFEIYCPHLDDYETLYERLQDKMNVLAPAAGIRLRMGAMPTQGGQDAVQSLDQAATACSMARGNFKEHLIVFDEKMRERESHEQRLLNDLHRALNSYEFEVYYQPQYDIQCDPPKLVSAEALVRWNHPELGMIPPNDFIPLFERNGKIGEVDRYVWSEAARQIARWRDLYDVTMPVSVNLSRVDVFDPALESALEKLLAYNGLGQGMLKLEVTESAYTGNADQVIRVVEGLRRKGYVVEMDDFGTGYSSLNMLSAMPVDVLKMDRAFIRRIGESEKDAHLVGLILGIARNLKIPVVAEGVETEEQVRLLKKLGCSLVQGFYFARPMPATEFEDKVIKAIRQNGQEPNREERGE